MQRRIPSVRRYTCWPLARRRGGAEELGDTRACETGSAHARTHTHTPWARSHGVRTHQPTARRWRPFIRPCATTSRTRAHLHTPAPPPRTVCRRPRGQAAGGGRRPRSAGGECQTRRHHDDDARDGRGARRGRRGTWSAAGCGRGAARVRPQLGWRIWRIWQKDARARHPVRAAAAPPS
ncbi:hypothetical protein HYPSUDRAFT_1002658 [Hypholoma sublateritium FD-334 SS-4]|uniref:Uncharacterized protein n=1 Tax=Hypholoma sublateritium (strain FD-334 SS-4) TaxID=945553 RepID=A0A0D2KT34_HYPSF|nr:hypothetical protein HYPSUDRAFT_1002658 [Hypholoma sublateritium FD-334 SS-4]